MARKRKKSRSKEKQRKAERHSEAQATGAPHANETVPEPDPAVEDITDEVHGLGNDTDEDITHVLIDDADGDHEQLVAKTMEFIASEEPSSKPDTNLSMTHDAIAALRELKAEGLIELSDDLVIDLGEARTDDQRDRLLVAALAHVEMQEARYRVPSDARPRRRWKGTAASVLVTLAALVAVAPPAIVIPEPPAQLTDSDRAYGVLVALLVQAQQVDAFRVREQRLPDSLDEISAVLHDIRFVKSSNRIYQLVAYTTDGIAVVYDSSAPAAIFQRIADGWITTRKDM